MPTPARRRSRLGADFGPLEDRSLPAQFGIPWPDTGHLTLSFTPDGTTTPAGASQLGTTFAGASGYQREILRAFQSWAVNTNVNIGLVSDGGQPLGAAGAVQGDRRFGDVRVAAVPLNDPNELAFASPFTWTGTTFAGDVLFDSTRPFAVGNVAGANDVFTVAAHEAGHVFGLDHSPEVGSVMNPTYSFETGLSAGDVTRIQSLYGKRTPDAYDAAPGGNDTMSRATTIPKVAGSNTQYQAVGDLTTVNDVDYYKLTVPSGTASVTARLKVSGESLLTAKYTLTTASGQVLATGAATDPLANDLTLTWANPYPTTYYLRLEGADDSVFSVGGYRLVVDMPATATAPPAALPTAKPAVVDGGTNDTRGNATRLDQKTATDARFDAAYTGLIETATDTDFYKIHSPKDVPGQALNVLVWGTEVNPVLPAVHVYDKDGLPLAAQVVANDAGVVSVRVANVAADKDYYVQVLARAPGTTGGYVMGADFNLSAAPVLTGVATGLQSSLSGDGAGTLTVAQTGVYQFAASAASLLPWSGAGVTVELVDAGGTVAVSLAADANVAGVTRTQYLPTGVYTIRYRYRGGVTAIAALRYQFCVQLLTDPIGPKATDVTNGGGTPPPAGGYVYDGASDVLPTGLPPIF